MTLHWRLSLITRPNSVILSGGESSLRELSAESKDPYSYDRSEKLGS